MYNGYKPEEFVPEKTSAYVSQYDLHIPEITVRETLDFSTCQGVGSRADILLELSRREEEARIIPDPHIDTYMKATSVHRLKNNLQTDYTLKVILINIYHISFLITFSKFFNEQVIGFAFRSLDLISTPTHWLEMH